MHLPSEGEGHPQDRSLQQALGKIITYARWPTKPHEPERDSPFTERNEAGLRLLNSPVVLDDTHVVHQLPTDLRQLLRLEQ